MNEEINIALAMYDTIHARAINRFVAQPKAPCILPPAATDFSSLFSLKIPCDLEAPSDIKRSNIRHQRLILRAKYRGQPEILAFHMLLISYLRRDTPWTKLAKSLFFRLWREHQEALLEIISTRDLISAIRTIADHSDASDERLAAKMGVIYASLIKGYESERAIEGLDPSRGNFIVPSQCKTFGIAGMGGVSFGRDDSLEIVHLMIIEEVAKHSIVGPLLLLLIKRVSDGNSLFSRIDQARQQSQYRTDDDRDWSFGIHPSQLRQESPELPAAH